MQAIREEATRMIRLLGWRGEANIAPAP
jgi:hypothetical protein